MNFQDKSRKKSVGKSPIKSAEKFEFCYQKNGSKPTLKIQKNYNKKQRIFLQISKQKTDVFFVGFFNYFI